MEPSSTRERILQAARERFAEQGFANTAVREICEDAGVTAPVLYYHFGNKSGIFQAVVEEAINLDGFCALLRKSVAACSDPWDKLRTFISVYLTAFPVHTLNPGLHLGDSAQLSSTSLRRFGLGIESAHRLAAEILKDGIAAGVFRAVEADTVAACLLGTVDSFVRSRTYLEVEFDIDEIVVCLVDLWADGLRAG